MQGPSEEALQNKKKKTPIYKNTVASRLALRFFTLLREQTEQKEDKKSVRPKEHPQQMN